MISYISEDMERARGYCAIGHRIRSKNKLPLSYPVQEIKVNCIEMVDNISTGGGVRPNMANRNFLPRGYVELIEDELNTLSLDTVIDIKDGKITLPDGDWEIESEGDLTVAIRIDKDDRTENLYKASKTRRELMRNRKESGLWTNNNGKEETI